MRLLLFNAEHASPGRSRRQAEWIVGQEDSDIAVLTEVSSAQGGDAVVTALSKRGYATLVAPQPSTPDYRAVIACRTSDVRPVPSPVTVTPHRAPAARVTVGGHGIGVLGLYVPSRGPKDQCNVAKRAFQAAGLTDAYRHLHPDEITHSWYGRSGKGFPFDHLFVPTPQRRPHPRLRIPPESPRSGADRPRSHDAAPGPAVHAGRTGRSPSDGRWLIANRRSARTSAFWPTAPEPQALARQRSMHCAPSENR